MKAAIVTGAPDAPASSHPYGLASATTLRRVLAVCPTWTSFQPAKVDQISTGLDSCRSKVRSGGLGRSGAWMERAMGVARGRRAPVWRAVGTGGACSGAISAPEDWAPQVFGQPVSGRLSREVMGAPGSFARVTR